MNNDPSKKFDSVYSKKLRAGRRRTYFFDVRATRANDYFLTITESVKQSDYDEATNRHKIFVYKEDFNRFVAGLVETVEYIKADLMPEYDFDEFTRRQEEADERARIERETGVEQPNPYHRNDRERERTTDRPAPPREPRTRKPELLDNQADTFFKKSGGETGGLSDKEIDQNSVFDTESDISW